jgi:hypothetical protein
MKIIKKCNIKNNKTCMHRTKIYTSAIQAMSSSTSKKQRHRLQTKNI